MLFYLTFNNKLIVFISRLISDSNNVTKIKIEWILIKKMFFMLFPTATIECCANLFFCAMPAERAVRCNIAWIVGLWFCSTRYLNVVRSLYISQEVQVDFEFTSKMKTIFNVAYFSFDPSLVLWSDHRFFSSFKASLRRCFLLLSCFICGMS